MDHRSRLLVGVVTGGMKSLFSSIVVTGDTEELGIFLLMLSFDSTILSRSPKSYLRLKASMDPISFPDLEDPEKSSLKSPELELPEF